MPDESKRLTHLRLSQKGILQHDQLSGAGVTRAQVRWRLHSGRWQTVLPRVYAMFTGPLHERHRLIAAQLYGGPRARLTGAAALQVHGLRNLPKDKVVRVLVPVNRRLRSTGFVRVERTTRLGGDLSRNGILRLASPARAVIDAARWCADRRQVRAMVAESVQAGHCTPEELAEQLRTAPRAGTACARVAVQEVLDGVRSVAEAEARDLLLRSKILPPLLWNVRLVAHDGVALPTPDGWLAEVDLALEIDSRTYHLSPEHWERTMRRHALLTRYGALVLHASPRQIRVEPDEFVSTVERAYLERLRTGYRSAIRVAG